MTFSCWVLIGCDYRIDREGVGVGVRVRVCMGVGVVGVMYGVYG